MSDIVSPRLKIFNGVTDPETLHCTKCEQDKPLDAFTLRNPRSLYRSRYAHTCRQCHNKHVRKNYDYERSRDLHLWRTYNGFTLADYNAMFEAQGGVCACCGKPETSRPGRTKLTTGKPISLAIDHDHKTGRVRALLCHSCNQTIGHLGEDPERALQMYEYLRRMS